MTLALTAAELAASPEQRDAIKKEIDRKVSKKKLLDIKKMVY